MYVNLEFLINEDNNDVKIECDGDIELAARNIELCFKHYFDTHRKVNIQGVVPSDDTITKATAAEEIDKGDAVKINENGQAEKVVAEETTKNSDPEYLPDAGHMKESELMKLHGKAAPLRAFYGCPEKKGFYAGENYYDADEIDAYFNGPKEEKEGVDDFDRVTVTSKPPSYTPAAPVFKMPHNLPKPGPEDKDLQQIAASVDISYEELTRIRRENENFPERTAVEIGRNYYNLDSVLKFLHSRGRNEERKRAVAEQLNKESHEPYIDQETYEVKDVPDDHVTATQAIPLSGVSRATFYNKIKSGDIPEGKDFGGRKYWSKDDLAEFNRNNKNKGSTQRAKVSEPRKGYPAKKQKKSNGFVDSLESMMDQA